ncbi:class F sortase [Frankia sp. Mgl5]|uniref:class F sortase n=1 Tax=Frankia sp. Mgl5 TaxID=2933793 RepID=UPI00200CA14D|nr:class F sortase [Frankia sp. Mgl5]MCK9929781.1 class F sortase [Frankia sp. Mgl5]
MVLLPGSLSCGPRPDRSVTPPAATSFAVGTGSGGGTSDGGGTGAHPAQVADPVRVRIPAIAVSAPVVPLALDEGGRLRAPAGFDETGWNFAGPEPGEAGTAVIAGHVDSRTGPAVFFRLRELAAGDRVEVDRADGSSAVFVVRGLARFPKDAVPAADVYGPTGAPALRLITCGGVFDQARSSYRDNIVVFADMA